MVGADTFGELRSVLARTPSARAWSHLCELCERADPAQVEQVLVPYLEGGLREWPDALRLAPPSWLMRVVSGRCPPAWPLVRGVSITGLVFPGVEEACAMALSPAMEQVRYLEIRAPGPAALSFLDALASGEAARRLEVFALSDWSIAPGRMVHALRRGEWEGLRRLELVRDRLDTNGLLTLSGASWFAQLEHLDLRSNALDDRAARFFCSRELPALVHLNLGANKLTGRGVAHLRESSLARQLEALGLRGNLGRASAARMTPPGAVRLSANDLAQVERARLERARSKGK